MARTMALMGAAASMGCSIAEEGSLLFELTLPDRVEPTVVSVSCEGGRERDAVQLPLSRPGSSGPWLARWEAVPAGRGRTCQVETLDGACRGTAGGIDVAPAVATLVELVLHCGDAWPVGALLLAAEVNVCPGLLAVDANPTSGTVGVAQVVNARVTNLDGDPLRFRWTVHPEEAGAIDDPTINPIRFTCRRPGTVAVTVYVDDGRGCGFPPEAEVVVRETARWSCWAPGS